MAGLGASIALALGLGWALAWWIPLPERLTEAGSPVVTDQSGEVLHVFLAADDRWRIPVDLDRVDPRYVEALLALEDERFWWHPGVDPAAIARAAGSNLMAGRRVSGASTLTMQLVRLVEPRPRTWTSKAVEALRAMQLEVRLSKRQILEAYLSFVPYGGNVEGVESGALGLLGHEADALTDAEIALLLAIPQAPSSRSPGSGRSEVLKAARDDIARRLHAGGVVFGGEDALVDTLSQPVPQAMRPMRREAPHLAVSLTRRRSGDARLQTSLDRGVQRLVERVAAGHRETLAALGIHNGAVVVLEHATGEARALLGSFDFWDPDHGGQIAAFDVPRSPGSTLKPFIYALGIDGGLVLPEMLVSDVPVRYGTYAPENYDGGFDGVVPLEEALSRSLNVPFVTLLGEVGLERGLGWLRANGVRSLNNTPGHYGLSAAIGGLELTPLELAGLYSVLASDGRWHGVHLEPHVGGEPRQSLSPGAAWLTRRALMLRDRPDFPGRVASGAMPRNLHWKTGTSFGNRDAWAVGSGQRFTVAVWLGNVDNTSSHHLVGAEAAGPLLFDVLEALRDEVRVVPDAPSDLSSVEVCALTGWPVGPACTERRSVLAVTSHVPVTVDPYHQLVEVDVASGRRVLPGCRAGLKTHEESVVVWPVAVRRWLSDSHMTAHAPPALAPGCEAVTGRPRIVSPEADEVVLLIPGLPREEQEVALEGSHSHASALLSWFVDGDFLGTAPADGRVWWTPSEGEHEVVVTDDQGISDTLILRVRGG